MNDLRLETGKHIIQNGVLKMLSGSENEREVAKVLLQLDLYLKTLKVPVTVKDLYKKAYMNRLGDYYNDHWIDLLHEDPEFQSCLEEPFTLQTIMDTLVENGHKPLLFALLRLRHRLNIGYSHAFVISIAQE